MNCNSKLKNTHFKSAQAAYNNSDQAFTAVGTPITILGNIFTDTGCSISTAGGGFSVNNSGLYRVSYDVTFTAAGAGVAELSGIKDNAAMPCMNAQTTVAAGSVYTLHIETIIYVAVCCANAPVISAMMSGVAGTISHVCASMVKLA